MKTITVKPNQTIYDIAIEQYGTCEAVEEIVKNNPQLKNDPAAVSQADELEPDVFRFELPLSTAEPILIDTRSETMRPQVVKKIENDVTTYNYDKEDQ